MDVGLLQMLPKSGTPCAGVAGRVTLVASLVLSSMLFLVRLLPIPRVCCQWLQFVVDVRGTTLNEFASKPVYAL
ncbi:MAG: hypothetical protein LC127_13170 [Chitinophagales bacterium]|nr:hypothetical protein [Chitinophagales bacterium]